MTKKLISIVLAVCMLFSIFAIAGVSVQAAEDDTTSTTVYLQPGVWTQDGAWFAAYFFENGKQDTTVKMTAVEGKYMAAVPTGYTNVIFVRMNPDYQEFNWDGKWNQTSDLTVQPLGTYTITDWATGEWSAPAQPGTTAAGTTAAQETSAAKVVHVDVIAPGLSGAWRIWTWNDNEDGIWTSLAYGAATVRDNFLMAYFESGASTPSWDIAKEQTNDVVAVDGAYYKILNEKENGKYKLVNVSEETTTAADTTAADTTAEPAEETTAAPASGDAVYLKPNTDWSSYDAWFAAYFFNNEANIVPVWVKMTQEGDLYKAALPADPTYTQVIFCRMASGSETMAWNTDTVTNVWNQTADLTVQAGKTYEITGWETGQWINGPATEDTTAAQDTTAADTTEAQETTAADTTAPVATGNTVYLKPNDDWRSNDAWFAAYFFVDDTNVWVRGTEYGDLYKFVIPFGVDYKKVIFVRMNSAATVPGWEQKWNQTADLDIQVGKTYEITGWETGQWIDGPVVEPTTEAQDTTAADTTEAQETTAADTTAPVATGNTVYLKPNDDWRSNNAWFAAYFFVDDTNVWVRGTEYGDLYKFVIPFGADYKKVIFVRMNSAATVPGWEQKWNQTADLDIQVGKTYEITGWETGQWIDGPVVEPTTEAQDTTAADTTAPVATGNTVYLKPNDDWRSNNAWFAAYFFVDDTNVWVRGTEYGDLYKFVIPFGADYKKVIFVRMNSAATVPGWEQKWNQTADLDIQVGKTYEITGWETGQWIDGPVVEPTTEAQDTTAADTTAPVATGNTVYLKPNDDWRSNNAWFAAYFFVDDTNVWVRGTEYGDLYKFVIPFGADYKKVIFVRMDSAATVPGWEQKWNQTADLDIQVGKTYEITDWESGQWIDGPVVEPTTAAPTTVAPTTEQPTTEAPTTEPVVVSGAVYLKPNTDWSSYDAWFAAYFFNSEANIVPVWVKMTKDGDLYKAELPADPTYTEVIFCRMAPGSETMAWNTDTETHVWNQTADLTVQAGKTYEITGWETGQWIDGPVEPTTAAPTTEQPTTEAPTTEEPTTAPVESPVHLDKFRITGYNLSLGSNIAIQTYVSDAKVAGYDTFWLTASAEGKDEIAMTADSHSNVYGSVYVYDQIFSNEMYKDVSFVLHATKDGIEYYGDPFTTSIKTYALNDLKSATGAYKTLLVDLLNYGAASQTYTGSNSVPVNSTLTPEQQACATQDYTCTYNNGTVARIDNPSASWYGAQCVLGSSIQPQLTFKDNTGQGIDGVYVRAVMNGQEYRIQTYEVTGYNQYSFTFDKVFANQLATPIEFTIMNNGTAISNTYRFDVESYAAQCFQNGTAADQAMIAAMVKYGRGAKAFAG